MGDRGSELASSHLPPGRRLPRRSLADGSGFGVPLASQRDHRRGARGDSPRRLRLCLAGRSAEVRSALGGGPRPRLERARQPTLPDPQVGGISAMTALSIVVPCFNEQECLGELYQRLSKAARVSAGEDYELVLVNDGSNDRSWPIMLELAERDPRVVAINLSRNHGHQL